MQSCPYLLHIVLNPNICIYPCFPFHPTSWHQFTPIPLDAAFHTLVHSSAPLLAAYHSTHHHTLNLILSFICIILQSQLCIHIHHFHFTSINSHSYSHSFPHLPIQCNTIIYFFSSNSPSMLISLSSPSPSSLHPYNTSHLITHSNHPNPIPIPFPRPTRHETPSHHSPFLHFLSLITDSFNPPLLSYVWTFLCRN